MQFSSRLTIATHILLCIEIFKDDYKITSNFLAGSIHVNPVIVRNILGLLSSAGIVEIKAGIGGASLAKSPCWMYLKQSKKKKLFFIFMKTQMQIVR